MSKRWRLFLVGLFFALMFICAVANIYLVFATSLTASYPGWMGQQKNGRVTVFKMNDDPRLAALHNDDEVIAFNGQPVTNSIAPINKYFSVAELGEYHMTVRREGGATQELTLRTLPLPFVGRIGFVLSVIIIPVVFLFTGFALFVLKPYDKQALLLALLFAMYTLINSSGFTIAPLWLKTLFAVAYLTACFAPPIFLHFTQIFPDPSPLVRRFPRLEFWLYLPTLLLFLPLLTVFYALRLFAPERVAGLELPRLSLAITIVSMLYISGGIFSLFNSYRRANYLSRRKLRVILAGTVASFTPPLIYFLASFVLDKRTLTAFGGWPQIVIGCAILLLPVSFAYAILRHKVIPVSLILRRSVRYLLVSRGSVVLEVAVVSLALVFFLHNFFKYFRLSGLTIGIVSAVFAIIVWNLTAAFNHHIIKPVIDRRFFRQAYDAHAILSGLSQAVRTVTNTNQLLELVIIELQQALHTENVTIFLRDETTNDYVCALSSEYQADIHASVASHPPFVLPHNGLTLQHLRGASQPLHVDFTDPNSWVQEELATTQNENYARGRETLLRIHTTLLLPLETKDRMLGIVSLGPRLGDLPFSNEDERLLMSVAAQTSVALDNAHLVERMITEERRRHQIEAENNRRARELDEARNLQLSMLPRVVPQLPNLEIATYMKPATEVGGDYYDFHVGEDGTLTVAVGDATGHGLKAGTMVTAAKSLFETLAHTPDIPQIFNQSSRVLKRMNLRSLYMAMMMMKIKDNHLKVSVAGMPPLLIYRAATKCVEELALTGMPLGSLKEFPYKQAELQLSVGDTLMLMSDGFPEMFNEAGEMLDYAKAKSLLEEIAHASPQEIVNHFVRVGDEWAGTRAQDDDVTFVVLQVKNGNGVEKNGSPVK
ncbi:MAG: GAF domain-containing SpoIIE family protein phosphatase [Pyrinomonadaceae bacterium]